MNLKGCPLWQPFYGQIDVLVYHSVGAIMGSAG